MDPLGGGAHCSGMGCGHDGLAVVTMLPLGADRRDRPRRGSGGIPRPHRRTRGRHVRSEPGPFRPDAA